MENKKYKDFEKWCLEIFKHCLDTDGGWDDNLHLEITAATKRYNETLETRTYTTHKQWIELTEKIREIGVSPKQLSDMFNQLQYSKEAGLTIEYCISPQLLLLTVRILLTAKGEMTIDEFEESIEFHNGRPDRQKGDTEEKK